MSKQTYIRTVELSEELSEKIYPNPLVHRTLEAEFEIEFWTYGAYSEVETEIEFVNLIKFYDNGQAIEVDLSDELKEQVIASIDTKDYDFILSLEEEFYCGMDY